MNPEKSTGQYVRIVYKTPQFINVISTIYNVPAKFVKHLEKTDLYEMRVSVGTNEYRTVLFAIDHDNVIEANRIILLNAFLKKDNRDYRKQVETAISILNNLEL